MFNVILLPVEAEIILVAAVMMALTEYVLDADVDGAVST